jgi:hypothetical protein
VGREEGRGGAAEGQKRENRILDFENFPGNRFHTLVSMQISGCAIFTYLDVIIYQNMADVRIYQRIK